MLLPDCHDIKFIKISFRFEKKMPPTMLQTARPADLYLLHICLTRTGPERNLKYDLALCIIKSSPISPVTAALTAVHFSLCDSLTLLCIYSPSQLPTMIQLQHYSQFLDPRSTSKHHTQEAKDQSLRNPTSRSSLSKPGSSFIIST